MKTKKLRFTHDQLHTIKVLPNTLDLLPRIIKKWQ